MVVEDRIAGQTPLTIVARLHALLHPTEVVGTVVQRLLMAVALMAVRCRLMAVARLRARCLLTVVEGEVEPPHPAAEALGEAGRQAAVAADTLQFPAQAADRTEAAEDDNPNFMPAR